MDYLMLNISNMKKLKFYVIIAVLVMAAHSCSTSKAVISHGVDLSKYSYVVFGNEMTKDEELADIAIAVQNEIVDTKLIVVSVQDAQIKIEHGEFVLTPDIYVKTEKWDGGHTYITITFYDYGTNQRVAVLKSSGIGLSISQDQNIAFSAIKKKLKQTFGDKYE